MAGALHMVLGLPGGHDGEAEVRHVVERGEERQEVRLLEPFGRQVEEEVRRAPGHGRGRPVGRGAGAEADRRELVAHDGREVDDPGLPPERVGELRACADFGLMVREAAERRDGHRVRERPKPQERFGRDILGPDEEDGGGRGFRNVGEVGDGLVLAVAVGVGGQGHVVDDDAVAAFGKHCGEEELRLEAAFGGLTGFDQDHARASAGAAKIAAWLRRKASAEKSARRVCARWTWAA